jgi:hypothetical protein
MKDIGLWSNREGAGTGGPDGQFCGNPDEVCNGFGAHFGHDAGAADLDGLFYGPKMEGDLFVQHARDDEPEDLVFARSERPGDICSFVLDQSPISSPRILPYVQSARRDSFPFLNRARQPSPREGGIIAPSSPGISTKGE